MDIGHCPTDTTNCNNIFRLDSPMYGDLYDSDDLILKRVTRELESQKITSGKLLFALAGSD